MVPRTIQHCRCLYRLMGSAGLNGWRGFVSNLRFSFRVVFAIPLSCANVCSADLNFLDLLDLQRHQTNSFSEGFLDDKQQTRTLPCIRTHRRNCRDIGGGPNAAPYPTVQSFISARRRKFARLSRPPERSCRRSQVGWRLGLTDTILSQLAALKTAPINALKQRWRDLFEAEALRPRCHCAAVRF